MYKACNDEKLLIYVLLVFMVQYVQVFYDVCACFWWCVLGLSEEANRME